MDPAGFDQDGNLFILGASESPQLAPGIRRRPELGNGLDLLPVSVNKIARSTSNAPGRAPAYAMDNSMRTWWEALPDDPAPSIEVDLYGSFTVAAVRILWAEPGLDYDRSVLPVPRRYRVELRNNDKAWKTVLDMTHNEKDMLIDYHVFQPTLATRARVVVTERPQGIRAAIQSLTFFGKGVARSTR